MKKIFAFINSELGRIVIGASLFIMALVTELLTEDYSPYYAFSLYILALLVSGMGVFISALRGILRGDLLDEKFLMSIASIGAMIIGDATEGVAVMLFFLVGEFFEHKAVSRSRQKIKSLMDINPDEATVIRDGIESVVDAEDVALGDTVVIRAGERVPVDCEVVSGESSIDTSALTGESIPRSATVGTLIDSGSVVLDGVVYARVLRPQDESRAARILELVENATENKSREESFITVFSRFYTPIVVALAVLFALIPPLFSLMEWRESVYSALSFLVISCPCALVISVPLAFFGGIGGAASKGILFKGGNVFAPLARADLFAFDKTGTLTNGKFKVTRVATYGTSEEDALYYAASAEYGSNHPLAKCIQDFTKRSGKPTEYKEIPGRGTVATVDGRRVLVGNAAHLASECVTLRDGGDGAQMHVAVDGVHVASIFIGDSIRDEARVSLDGLRSLGVRRTVMLSGDSERKARAVGDTLSLDEVYAPLLPEEKYNKLSELVSSSRNAVYVGDGINDAPAIALADVGVAMGAIGTDSAIEAADLVIMSDDLTRLPIAVKHARRTLGIAKWNIGFAIAVKVLVLIFAALGIANMWLAVFADVGVAVIAILNSMRCLKI